MGSARWLVVCFALAVSAGANSSTQSSPDVVVIDGSKGASGFPDWKIAEVTLIRLAYGSALPGVPITATETQAILTATESFKRARSRMGERFQKGRADGILRQPTEVVKKDEHDIHLEYRFRVLEILDQLHAGLSPERQDALRTLSHDAVATTTIQINRADLAHFREPR